MIMNLSGFRPMKSATPDQGWDFGQLSYPLWASPKVDGWRGVVLPERGLLTNTLKPVANVYVAEWFRMWNGPLSYLDGELVVGDLTDPRSFNQTQSALSSQGGEPDFTYLVFDNFEAGATCGFGIRKEDAKAKVDKFIPHPAFETKIRVKMLEQVLIENLEQLLAFEEKCLGEGYEGVITRHPQGKYKFGRSTLKQQGMVKMKRFIDDEAVIIGWEPLERNNNEAVTDALGLSKRGYSKEGKVVDDTRVGRFRLRGTTGRFLGVEFWCGSGLDDSDRLSFRRALQTYGIEQWPKSYWAATRDGLFNNADNPMGKIITYKYQAHGSLDAPRTPIWKGIRHDT